MNRVLLRLQKNGEVHIPKFSECIIDYFEKDATAVDITYEFGDGVLDLIHSKGKKEEAFNLQHSVECPLHVLRDEAWYKPEAGAAAERNQTIQVAVSVIVESSDKRILLTRRSPHMRSHPGVWVPPGGHLELGETLIECGHREVLEETGLDLSHADTRVLCLWENVYPIFLGMGWPKSHVLVVYCLARCPETHHQLLSKVAANPQEVASYTWFSLDAVADLVRRIKGQISTQYLVQPDGTVKEATLDHKGMFNQAFWANGKTYSGVQYALRTWHSIYTNKNPQSKY